MKNKLVLMIAIAVLILQFSACQIKTSATNTISNPVEKPKTEIVNITNDEPNFETETNAPSAPEPVVLEFYKLYLKALVANKNLSPDVMKRYLTARMLTDARCAGSDPDDAIHANDTAPGTRASSPRQRNPRCFLYRQRPSNNDHKHDRTCVVSARIPAFCSAGAAFGSTAFSSFFSD